MYVGLCLYACVIVNTRPLRMVGALDSGSSGSTSNPEQDYYVVFLGKALYSQCLSPPRSINRYRHTVRQTRRNAGCKLSCDRLAYHSGRLAKYLSCRQTLTFLTSDFERMLLNSESSISIPCMGECYLWLIVITQMYLSPPPPPPFQYIWGNLYVV